ncbi:SPFH domain-containing protein [Ralstonia pickettii]|uniref:SPFH domain-containing protein n=1 Tax=Ralstonia pickettii TaxID=329 RepID=UPI0027149D05|nr:SPFH domain-containing protein [Ralstonia pickettii]WKZ86284.1 SPFH domain-containing protein [Ralstonia pickettii]
MKKLFIGLAMLFSLALTGCGGTINTGNVGVRTSFGKVDPQEVHEGIYVAILSHVDEYTVKETSIELENLQPRARDNLTLKDLDATVYYKTNPSKIAEFVSTHSGQSAVMKGENFARPGYFLVQNIAKGQLSDEVSKLDSLTLHQNRQKLEDAVRASVQAELDKDPTVRGTFEVTRVVVRTIMTDPTIEDAIRQAVSAQKQLEAKEKQIEIAKKDAEIEKTRASGKAAANAALNQTLTKDYLQHEYNEALLACAQRAGCTMIVGSAGNTLLNVGK